ncbi:MAG: phosphonate degradation HD-domain oxygenase [Microcoleaceae cyanobacterium]
MKPNLETIIKILSLKGDCKYTQESVTQLQHALQCATLAEACGASKELITACLFHDIGHLVHNLGEDGGNRRFNNHHEYLSVKYLKHLFGKAITEPILLHVEAKRYLCAIKPDYFSTLSPASQINLELQGGVFSPQTAAQFIHKPYAKEAVQLRMWDNQAKVIGKKTPDLKYFTKIVYQAMVISNIGNVLSSKFISATGVNH